MAGLCDIYRSRIEKYKSHYYRFLLYGIRSPPQGHFHLESKKNLAEDVKYVTGILQGIPGISEFKYSVYSCTCKIKEESDCCWFKGKPQKHMKTVSDFTKTSKRLNYMLYIDIKIREIKFSIDMKKMHDELYSITQNCNEFYTFNIIDNTLNKSETTFKMAPNINGGKSNLLNCFIKNAGSIQIEYKDNPAKTFTKTSELDDFIKEITKGDKRINLPVSEKTTADLLRYMMIVKIGKITYL